MLLFRAGLKGFYPISAGRQQRHKHVILVKHPHLMQLRPRYAASSLRQAHSVGVNVMLHGVAAAAVQALPAQGATAPVEAMHKPAFPL
jgi:hypothetical protein